jgi:hypothetical protein
MLKRTAFFDLPLAALLVVASAAPAYAADPDDPLSSEVAAATTSTAAAQEPADTPPKPDDGDRWEFTIAPYLWASSMKADISTPQGENVQVDESFTKILSAIKFAFMGAFDARKGRFVTVHDLIFLHTGSSTKGSIGPGLVEADADLRTIVVTSVAGYRVVDKGPMFVDLMAGARLTSMRTELGLTGPLRSVERENSKTKIGPVIAGRVRVPFNEKWGAALYGDVGGFGIVADISWELIGTVQYDISSHWRLGAGWRHLVAKQDKNDFDADLKLSGPFLTAAYRF